MRNRTWEYAYEKRDRLGRYARVQTMFALPIGLSLLMVLVFALNHFNAVN